MQALERPAAGEPRGALVFYHGYYGIPDDFLGFVDKLDPDRRLHAYLPAARFVIGDEGRRSWFEPDAAFGDLEQEGEWLDGLPFLHEHVVLGGWSQGAVVAYALGLAAGRPRPAGVVALGGALPLGVTIAGGVPVAIGHGRADDAVPVAQAREARAELRRVGIEPLYLETDIDHRIDQASVPALREFVATAVRP